MGTYKQRQYEPDEAEISPYFHVSHNRSILLDIYFSYLIFVVSFYEYSILVKCSVLLSRKKKDH